MRYSKYLNLRRTPQSKAVPGAGQVRNSAGGHVWALDRWAVLERLLILGTEGRTFYASENKLTVDQATNLQDAIAEDGPRVVDTIAKVSWSGRAAKNDAAIFSLAMAAAFGDEKTKQAAYAAVPAVARTGTQLFQFADESQALRGWGRGLRKAVGRWYLNREVDDLIYQLVKYRQRNGWTHADLLRLAHPKADGQTTNDVFKWAVDGVLPEGVARLEAFARLQLATSADEAARLITEFDLPREAVPTELLHEKAVWEALLAKMPMTAMLRNLATMTRVGLLTPGSDATRTVVGRLKDAQRLKAARIHPLSVLVAMQTYGSGHGLRSSATWPPVPVITAALDEAFRLAFDAVEPTGKRYVLGLDVSGSMGWGTVCGSPVTPAQAAAAMMLTTLATEESVTPMAFAGELRHLGLHGRMSLTEVLDATARLTFGATDCALPMLWAAKNKVEADVFVVYTDNETWAGNIHPFQALAAYRQKTGIAAKLMVVGMTSNGFSIADPRDAGMLDVVGMDTSVPTALREFALA